MEEIVTFGRRCGKTTTAKKQQELIDMLTECGWKRDRFGHYQKDIPCRNSVTKEITSLRMRVKLQATSCRIEVQRKSDDSNQWIRFGGDYYINIVKLDDGRLRVGTYFFGKKVDHYGKAITE